MSEKSLYEAVDDLDKKELKNLEYQIDTDNPEIVPNCKVRLKESGLIGKVLWITELDIPVVRIGEMKMQIGREGLEKLKST